MKRRDPIIWGYCRVSTPHQSISRQEHNILKVFPKAIIVKEIYTGKTLKRDEFEKMLKMCIPGDGIAFDEVSRMSRNAEEGFEMWKYLYEKGINLYFLKQPHINSDVYKDVLQNTVPLVGDDIDLILEGVNKYLMKLAEKQIKLAFEQAEKELELLHKRTSDGMRMARLKGKLIGRPGGRFYVTQKAQKTKALIVKHNRAFGSGSLNDKETIKLTGINPKTFYKYKKDLLIELHETCV